MREHARQNRYACLPQAMSGPMKEDRMKPRIRKYDLDSVAGRGVALENSLEVGAERVKHDPSILPLLVALDKRRSKGRDCVLSSERAHVFR